MWNRQSNSRGSEDPLYRHTQITVYQENMAPYGNQKRGIQPIICNRFNTWECHDPFNRSLNSASKSTGPALYTLFVIDCKSVKPEASFV